MKTIRVRMWDYLHEAMHYSDDSGFDWIFDLPNRHKCSEPMLFIGLLDKNGKEIFHKDILRDNTGKYIVVEWSEKYASWCLSRDGWMFNHYFGEAVDPKEVEVIGNTYENPGLIGG